jgi:DNA-binding MarR family transcriptional regulator
MTNLVSHGVEEEPLTAIRFELRFVPAGTGLAVWDDPHANQMIQRFMPPDRQHGPMIGVLHLGAVHPTPGVLQEVIVTMGEDIRAGRYGNFTFVVSSEDEATRSVVSDIASAQDLAIFVSSSAMHLEEAEPVGDLTAKDRETLSLVLRAGGTVTAAELAERLGVEQTTAGNRLVTLHEKGYLQRVERPHPFGDQFIDPRSVRFDLNW